MDGKIRVDAEGYIAYYDATSKCYAAAGRCRPYLKHSRRVLSANWMSLCCGVGNYVWKLDEVRREHISHSHNKQIDHPSFLLHVS